MFDQSKVIEGSYRPRKPSLPSSVYEVAHALRVGGATEGQMILFREICDRIAKSQIPCRPSVLEEFTRRALHGIGCSGMSDEEMAAFIKDCQDEL